MQFSLSARALLPFVLAAAAGAAHAELTVLATAPPRHASNVAPNVTITVDFDRPVDPATLASFRVYGNHGGPPGGTTALEQGGTRISFRPARPFFAGEVVMVGMASSLRAADGTFLRPAGYVTDFRVRSAPAGLAFTEIANFPTEPGVFTRIYGGQMCDIDGDDWTDMCIVSEVSNDVRVFKNAGDATGAFVQTPFSITTVPAQPSPNENGDLNGDGLIDVVTCNVAASSVSILLGNGNGSFQSPQSYSMGNGPHGLALLDCDGDGDLDVFTACTGSNNVAMRRNNGNGTLGAVSFFDGGGSGEYALTGADMDNDSIVDLVVGNRTSSTIVVLKCLGNGTFAPQPPRAAGGAVWMLVCGDVDADGDLDVATANGTSSTGSILYGNGDGTLQAAQVSAAYGHMPATDLADLDGDGDLDWVLSSFGAGAWYVLRNDGGAMNLVRTFTSSANPGCAALFDIDNDRDIDIVLLTETSDEIRVQENDALGTQVFCAGTGAACPCGNGGLLGHGCAHSAASGGALLNAQGLARVAADTLVLNCGGMPSAAPVLFYQGDTQTNGGSGSAFGDGLRCAGGTVARLGMRAAANGWAGWGLAGDTPISVGGALPPGGGTRYYQAWFRNAATYCTPDTFNLSNGVRVTWTP